MSDETEGQDEDRAGVDEISRILDDAAIHTCFKCHRAIAYEGEDCPMCELIERCKTLERELEELREREMRNLIELP